MSTMEQALRDEIAWHKERIDLYGVGKTVSATGLVGAHRTRLAALTAALPAPGVEAPGDWVTVPREMTAEMMRAADKIGVRDQRFDIREWHMAYAAMLSAAPSAPAEISQAQAMREALRNLLMEAGYMAGQLAHRGLPGVPGDSVDRALNAALAALTPEPPR